MPVDAPKDRNRFSLWAFIIAVLLHEGTNVLMALAVFGSAMSSFGPHNRAEQDVAFWNKAAWFLDFGPLWLEQLFPQLVHCHFDLLHAWSVIVGLCFGFLIPLIFRPKGMIAELKQDASAKAIQPPGDPY